MPFLVRPSARLAASVALSFGVTLAASAAHAQTGITITDSIGYTQNFDTLANIGTSSFLPQGWLLFETGTNANTTYAAGTGSANAGNTYSFGYSGSTERALGTLLSGTLTPTIGAQFTNSSGLTVTALQINYLGEQWRLGTLNRDADRLEFQYSLAPGAALSDATTSPNWTGVNALDFSSLIRTGTIGALDGNLYRISIGQRLEDLNWADQGNFKIRWNDFNVFNADDGLAVDDFSLTATAFRTSGTGSVGNGTFSSIDVAAGSVTTFTGSSISSLSLNGGDIVLNNGTTVDQGLTITSGNVTMNDGSTINGNVSTSGTGVFRMNGSSQNTVTTGGTVEIAGGSVNGITVFRGQTDLSGGTITTVAAVGGNVTVSGTAAVNSLTANGSSVLTISGGTIQDLFGRGNSATTWSGGAISPFTIRLFDNSTLNLLGSNLTLSSAILGSDAYGSYRQFTLNGLLLGGQSVSGVHLFDYLGGTEVGVVGNGSLYFNGAMAMGSLAAPEPTALALLLPIFGLAAVRRRQNT
ncbi:MAG: hypothetical protein SFU56_11750 [Capsulimonadales bacterium]|nr:hypothetical protein [Capsulimonadales bacterium]